MSLVIHAVAAAALLVAFYWLYARGFRRGWEACDAWTKENIRYFKEQLE